MEVLPGFARVLNRMYASAAHIAGGKFRQLLVFEAFRETSVPEDLRERVYLFVQGGLFQIVLLCRHSAHV